MDGIADVTTEDSWQTGLHDTVQAGANGHDFAAKVQHDRLPAQAFLIATTTTDASEHLERFAGRRAPDRKLHVTFSGTGTNIFKSASSRCRSRIHTLQVSADDPALPPCENAPLQRCVSLRQPSGSVRDFCPKTFLTNAAGRRHRRARVCIRN